MMHLTNRKTYTPTEVVDLFSEYVKPENISILVDHLSYPTLAKSIISFAEIDGDIHLNLGEKDSLLKIKRK